MRNMIAMWVALASIAAMLVSVTMAQERFSDGEYLRGLRQRQLFRLAETYCEKRLADSRLSPEQRADLVIHLSQVYTDHARQTPPEQADSLWEKAFRVTDDFARNHPTGGWPVVVRVQGSMVRLSRGELSRQRAEVTGQGRALLDESRGHLRTAVKSLRGQIDDVGKALREHQPVRGQPSRGELLSLEKNVRYQLARAYRNQGLCYPADSPDRNNSLQQSLGLLKDLAALATVDPLAWQARLEEITCLRLLKQPAAALRKLDFLEKEEPPPSVLLRARAQRVRLALAAGQINEALKVLQAGRHVGGYESADFDYAHLEVYLAAWKSATQMKNKAAAKDWQHRAVAAVRTIERQHPPYWARRAESLLASVIADAGLTGQLALLVRAAQGFYRGKQYKDAVETYDKAAAMAGKEENHKSAFDLAYIAATIEHERKNHVAAKDRFRKLALAQPKHAKAGEAHLLAVYNAGQEAQRQKPIQLDEYAALLREHLDKWPAARSANHARWSLGQYYELRRRWPDAITAYREIAADHDQYTPGVKAIARCYNALLGELRAESKPTLKLGTEAAAYFERLVLPGNPPKWPERWSPTERFAALAAGRFRLDYTLGDAKRDADTYRRVEQFLSQATRGQPAPGGEWTATAGCVNLIALAGQKRYAEAAKTLGDIAKAPTGDLLAMVDRFAELSRRTSGDMRDRVALGGLQAEAAALLNKRRSELDQASQKKLDVFRAQATADSGDLRTATAMFANLAKAFARDGDVQEGYARVLTEAGGRMSLEAALTKWREIERHSRKASPRWFRAKYHLALCYERLGNPRRAVQIIKITQVLHSELGGAEQKAQFEELLKRCEAPK